MNTIQVKYQGSSVSNLNELEFYQGYVMANIYMSTYVVLIDIENNIGEAKYYDFTGL